MNRQICGTQTSVKTIANLDRKLNPPVILIPRMLELNVSGDSRHVQKNLQPRRHPMI